MQVRFALSHFVTLPEVFHFKRPTDRLHGLVNVAIEASASLLVLVYGHAHFLLELGVELAGCARPLHITTCFLDRGGKLRNLAHDSFLDHAVIDHIFVVIRAPSTEEVNQRLAPKLRREMLNEASFELADL